MKMPVMYSATAKSPALIVCLFTALTVMVAFASPLTTSQITGICYTTYQRPETYLTSASDQKLLRIAATNAGWVNLRVSWSSAGYTSTDIEPNFATPSDDAMRHVIRFCHQHGMKVLLSLMVDFADDNAGGTWHWWGQIAPIASAKDAAGKATDGWVEWFDSYDTYVLHYAALAQSANADMFNIGTELISSSTAHEKEWRSLIAEVRKVYSGKITYQAHITEYSAVKFWDVLDYIGMNGYWKLSDANNPSITEVLASLKTIRASLQKWHDGLPAKSRKPILFTEVGYQSADGAATTPWARGSLTGLPNQALQKRCFDAFKSTFAGQPWVAGVFWWGEFPPGEAGVDERGAGHPFLGKEADKNFEF
jgi:hypothetical protein